MSVPPVPAALVILARASNEPAEEPFEVLLVRRHARAGFMPETDVFPGGKLEPGEAFEEAAARELLEEAGILLADGAEPSAVAAVRRGLRPGGRTTHAGRITISH